MFRKRWFVGVITLRVAGSRFFRPAWKLDWEGAVGDFNSEEEANEFVRKVKEKYPDYLARSKKAFGDLV